MAWSLQRHVNLTTDCQSKQIVDKTHRQNTLTVNFGPDRRATVHLRMSLYSDRITLVYIYIYICIYICTFTMGREAADKLHVGYV